MNILFITISNINSLDEKSIYTDLLREFKKNHHNVYIMSPTERRNHRKTEIKDGVLKVKIGNIQKTNMLEKGLSTLLIERQFIAAVKRYYPNVKFDLVMYSTPPITFANVIKYIKKRDGAKSYLLLKDIFPQNAIDLGMFGKKSIIYKYFRHKEKQLYKNSDLIGCMSQANVDYIIAHNPEIDKRIVHISPNSSEPIQTQISADERNEIRLRYNIPSDVKVFIYGGNLGKPQDIPFVIECLKDNADKSDRFFVICGTGTEYHRLKSYIDDYNPQNVLLINGLPKSEYNKLVAACDVGLIFLDHRFTIPNVPSRLLSYMQNSMPVIACTDSNTDIGEIIETGGLGWWCESDDCTNFTALVDSAVADTDAGKSMRSREYLETNCSTMTQYKIIMRCLNELV